MSSVQQQRACLQFGKTLQMAILAFLMLPVLFLSAPTAAVNEAETSKIAASPAEEIILYEFGTFGDGDYPSAGLIRDSAGNLFGTTTFGGKYGGGTVFELSLSGGIWQETVLHSFSLDRDGGGPYGAVTMDASGVLYGSASGGGAGYGTIFKLSQDGSGTWTFTVIHRFRGTDGADPLSDLTLDNAGDLYGTTATQGPSQEGTAFELIKQTDGTYKEVILYSFHGVEGNTPIGGLAQDVGGNLYGTTSGGGAYGYGTVFELSPTASGSWTHTVLYNFQGHEGAGPRGKLLFDSLGNIYGSAAGGGLKQCNGIGCGAVFELSPNVDGSWSETTLWSFNGEDGGNPYSGLVFDASGNLYGTTSAGGIVQGCYFVGGCGTVFELFPTATVGWRERVLYRFQTSNDGNSPTGGLVVDPSGVLFGTTTVGGSSSGGGTVYEIAR